MNRLLSVVRGTSGRSVQLSRAFPTLTFSIGRKIHHTRTTDRWGGKEIQREFLKVCECFRCLAPVEQLHGRVNHIIDAAWLIGELHVQDKTVMTHENQAHQACQVCG